MDNYLIVRIKATAGEKGMPIQWAKTDLKGNVQDNVHEGGWSELKEWLANCSLPENKMPFTDSTILLLPGTLVSTYQLAVTAAQKKHLNATVPFLLEEHLVTDIEDFHFIYQMKNSNEINVTAAPVELLKQLIELMTQHNCEPVKIVTENQLFGHNGKENSHLALFVENNYVHVCPPERPAVTLDRDAFLLVADQLLSVEESTAPDPQDEDLQTSNAAVTEQITLYQLSDDTEGSCTIENYLQQHYPFITVDKQTLQQEDGYFSLLTERLSHSIKKRTLSNLRTGAFACYKRIRKHWDAWKRIAVVACIWLATEVLFSAGSALFYRYKSDAFQSEALSLYKKQFPQDNSVVDVRTSLERKLRNINKPTQSNTFFDLLKQISVPEITQKKVVLNGIEYNEKGNHFMLVVTAPGYEEIESYMAVLRKKRLSVLMSDANNSREMKQVTAKLKITRGV
ncbi:MAG: type II secretion system protein GspL [Endozoicomonadaceae bacterium]|nr:type II secretion system protein GspL [Endozoicomonadaceae bacterium]